MLARLDRLPEARRQPKLLFAATRHTGSPSGSFAEFRRELLARWPVVREVMLARRTQTNEPGR